MDNLSDEGLHDNPEQFFAAHEIENSLPSSSPPAEENSLSMAGDISANIGEIDANSDVKEQISDKTPQQNKYNESDSSNVCLFDGCNTSARNVASCFSNIHPSAVFSNNMSSVFPPYFSPFSSAMHNNNYNVSQLYYNTSKGSAPPVEVGREDDINKSSLCYNINSTSSPPCSTVLQNFPPCQYSNTYSNNSAERSSLSNNTMHTYPYNMQKSNIVEVPLINQTVRRNRYIEVPEVHVIEKIHPKIQIKEIVHKVPRVDIQWIEKIEEYPEIRYINKQVEVPDICEQIKYVKKIEHKEVIREIPKYEVQYVSKYVEVPKVERVFKYVEIPEIREIKKFVEKAQIIEIPIEKIKKVPKVEIKKVEKIRYIEGEIEYIDIPVERIIEKPVYEIIEKIKEVPEIQEVVVETPLIVPSERCPVVDIPIEVPVFYDVPKYKKVPGKIIPIEREKIYEKIIEKPIPVPQETLRVIKVPREKKVEIIREVEVPFYVDEIVRIPKYVPVLAPPPIIMPITQDEIIDADPIYERASPRYVYEPPVYVPPVFEKVSQQNTQTKENCFQLNCSDTQKN